MPVAAGTVWDWRFKADLDELRRRDLGPLRCRGKAILRELAYAQAAKGGAIEARRARPAPWPTGFGPAAPEIELREAFYDYAPAGGQSVAWHMNFANMDAFSTWNNALMAQDEHQIAEHPDLALLRMAAQEAGHPMFCAQGGEPWPILALGAPRLLELDLGPRPGSGGNMERSIYGNAFRLAGQAELESRAKAQAPAMGTNLVAIEAPAFGRGKYSLGEIEYAARAAWSGFKAAADWTAQAWPGRSLELRLGFWGCGAYGGNKALLGALLLAAADWAGAGKAVFYAGSGGACDFAEAFGLYRRLREAGYGAREMAERLAQSGFEWGTPNGT